MTRMGILFPALCSGDGFGELREDAEGGGEFVLLQDAVVEVDAPEAAVGEDADADGVSQAGAE